MGKRTACSSTTPIVDTVGQSFLAKVPLINRRHSGKLLAGIVYGISPPFELRCLPTASRHDEKKIMAVIPASPWPETFL
jgi:hypothetical protein